MRLALALLLLAGPAFAHPHHYTDQQVSLTLGPDGVRAEISIMPSDLKGAEIFAALDADGDGTLSAAEMQALAAGVLAATRLRVDGASLPLALAGVNTPARPEMAAGHAIISIRAESPHVPATGEVLEFSIAYDRFDPAWSVQPWLAEGFPADGRLPVIRRRDGNAWVTVTLPGP